MGDFAKSVDLSDKIAAICKPLISAPEHLSVKMTNDERKEQAYLINCDEADVGKLLGRHGIISDSLRTIVNISLRAYKKKASLTFAAWPDKAN